MIATSDTCSGLLSLQPALKLWRFYHPCINKEKSSPKAKSISTTSQICIRNISWASATQHLHPPQMQMQTLELQFFVLDLNTLEINNLVPPLRKISITAVPYVIKKGRYLFQNLYTLEGSDYWRNGTMRQRKCFTTISRGKQQLLTNLMNWQVCLIFILHISDKS